MVELILSTLQGAVVFVKLYISVLDFSIIEENELLNKLLKIPAFLMESKLPYDPWHET